MSACGICGGRLLTGDPLNALQFDHKVPHSAGGPTSDDNLRTTHAFCNHRRDGIEEMQRNPKPLPTFINSQGQEQMVQLTFSELWDDPENDPTLNAIEDEDYDEAEQDELDQELAVESEQDS